MEAYVERLLPLFEEGQKLGDLADGNPEEVIAGYLTILTGVMVLGKGYTIPQVDWLLRFVIKR